MKNDVVLKEIYRQEAIQCKKAAEEAWFRYMNICEDGEEKQNANKVFNNIRNS